MRLALRWAGLLALPLVFALSLFFQAGAAPQARAAGGAGHYEGVASCAGSTCHGRAEGNGEEVRQDEIATWQEPSSPSGAHSRAYAVLGSPRGRQIAAALGLGPATSAKECLGCHATFAPAAQRGARFQISDGVGCESCHGPSGNWIASHYSLYEPDSGAKVTHAQNVANGMVPLENPQVRAQVCLDCHFGSTDSGQFVTHSMMAAGHPRVSFELDLFSALQQHHQVDADYRARKPVVDGVKLWAVGQAEAVRRQTRLFATRLGSQGVFPEYYFFDCHSCHRPINDGPNATRTFETNPGRPIAFGYAPFNDENMIMLSAVGRVLAPAQAAGFDQASMDFHRSMASGRADAAAAAGRLGDRAQALSGALAARSYGGNDAFTVIAAIAAKATNARFTDYTGSAQAVMAVDTLLNALVRDGRVTTGAAAGIRADINRAYAAVRSPQAYRPAEFRAALGRAAAAIEALR
ncbi:MAG: hypothetical protein IE933_00940 [Sphingomonadales bacterium]|nr:hypothetical protein [Sphingomonadales bacterium]MBD3772712.1 hypothetical protein [Paracoccaceae bacterium]